MVLSVVCVLGLLGLGLGAPVEDSNPCVPCDPEGYVYSIDTPQVISSPGFATNQICPNVGPCKYHIYANNGERVKINFNQFNTFGALTVYNGPKGDDSDLVLAHLRGVIASKAIPPIYSSNRKDGSGGVVTMVYQPTAALADAEKAQLGAGNFGFQATFTTTKDSGCGPSQISQSLYGPNVTIQTPNYPYNYPPDTSCRWNFTAPSSRLAQIAFSDDAHTESNYDFVIIKNNDGSLAGEYSGTKGAGNPPAFAPLKGSTQGLQVSFDSDDAVDFNGFQATLSGYLPPTVCDCGQTVYYLNNPVSTMTVTSPNFGVGHSGYCENANCTYNLIVDDEAYKAKVSFEAFELELNYDHLTISDGINGFELEDCTGTHCEPRTSDNSRLTLNFRTDSSVGKAGFKAIFSAVSR